MAVRLQKDVEKVLARERISRVATIGPNGVPHVVPICHVLDGGRLYFGTGRDSTKAGHLRANPRVAVTVDLYAEDWAFLKGVMLQGTAKLIGRGPRFRKIRGLLYRKYPQYPAEAAIEERDSLVVEVTPTRVASWGFEGAG